jgi:peptidyl-prolyl cis-trans isomerase C
MLNHTHFAARSIIASAVTSRKLAGTAIALALLAALPGCGPKAQKSGQALVSINGEEITASQLNEELQRSGVAPAQQQTASKQLLESLVERQLLVNEAIKEKTDREPRVVQAIERAKAIIIAQSYLQKKVGPPTKASKTEVKEYFDKHPELFSGRKQLEMRQLLLATSEMTDELKKVMDDSKSLDEVAAWMDQHKVRYVRNEVARSSADLPSALSAKLLATPKGQLFVIREGERSVLLSIVGVKDTPVDLAVGTPQIEQYLSTTRAKEAATAEMARLRAAAKIEYLNKAAVPGAAPEAKPAAAAEGKPAAAAEAKPDGAVERGVAGLK